MISVRAIFQTYRLTISLYFYFAREVGGQRQVGHEERLARWSKSTTQGSQAVLRGAGKGAEPPELAEVLMKLIYVPKLLRLFCIPCHVILVIFWLWVLAQMLYLNPLDIPDSLDRKKPMFFLKTHGRTRQGYNFVRLIKTSVAFLKTTILNLCVSWCELVCELDS